MAHTAEAAVVGGGIIGIAVAWQLSAHVRDVVVVDPEPGSGATATAAGMLAPVTELHYGEEALLALNVASALRYPAFVAELEDATGADVFYRRTGTVVAARDAADLKALRDLRELQTRLGLTAEVLSSDDLRDREPGVAGGLPGGIFAADDHSVDPRRLHAALLAGAAQRGVRILRERVVAVDEHATSVALAGGEMLEAGVVVLAAGSWSRGLVPGLPVRPVKGQTLRLRADPPPLRHVLRGSVRGRPVYLVPRPDGEVVVGASSEEAGFDLRARAGVVHDLLHDAQDLLPATTEMELVEVSTGLRPGTPDNAPIVGGVRPGLIAATGHYRNGVLLAPLTAEAVVAEILGEPPLAEAAAFGAQRFAVKTGAAG